MTALPSEDLHRATVLAALHLAARAPSVHNTQPWRWRIGTTSVHLFADRTRALPAIDPAGRDLVLSCGAALHHLQVALRAAGLRPTVHRLPDPAQPDHLAAVELVAGEPTADELTLAAAVDRRRTDRRAYSSWPVPDGLRAALVGVAAAAGARLVPIHDPRHRWAVARAVEEAAVAQALVPGASAEARAWSGRHRGAVDGVPGVNVPAPSRPDRADDEHIAVRHFAAAEQAECVRSAWAEDGTWLTLLTTDGDRRLDQLRAGESLSAVLLEATVIGLAGDPVTQPIEITEQRELLRREVLGGHGHPQAVLRLGWAPPSADPVPRTGRRPVSETVDAWDGPWP